MVDFNFEYKPQENNIEEGSLSAYAKAVDVLLKNKVWIYKQADLMLGAVKQINMSQREALAAMYALGLVDGKNATWKVD